jgi:hypothetical protein
MLQWMVESQVVDAVYCSDFEFDVVHLLQLPVWNSSSSSVFCGVQPLSVERFGFLSSLDVLRSCGLLAIVSLGRDSKRSYQLLLELGGVVLVEIPSHRIPLLSVKALSGMFGINHVSTSLSFASVLVWRRRLTLHPLSCLDFQFWRSLCLCLSECLLGGLWNVRVLCGEKFASEFSVLLSELSGNALAEFESFYMEREGLNLYNDRHFWMASLPSWFDGYLLELKVPKKCISLFLSLTNTALALDLQQLWMSFSEMFFRWRRENCLDFDEDLVDRL